MYVFAFQLGFSAKRHKRDLYTRAMVRLEVQVIIWPDYKCLYASRLNHALTTRSQNFSMVLIRNSSVTNSDAFALISSRRVSINFLDISLTA